MSKVKKFDKVVISILLYIVFSVLCLSTLFFEIWSFTENRILIVIFIMTVPCVFGTLLGFEFGKSYFGIHSSIKVNVFLIVIASMIIVINFIYHTYFYAAIVNLIHSTNSSSKYHQDINLLMLIIFVTMIVISSLFGYYHKR